MESQQITLRLQKIKLNDSENMKCADCSSGSTEYILVHFGSFICKNCAEVHKKIFNTLKSEKGPWTEREFLMVQAGGNIALKEFFLYYGLDDCSILYKYRTRAAYFYREMLSKVSQNLQFDEDFPSLNEGTECFDVGEEEKIEESDSIVVNQPLIVQESINRPIGCFERVLRYLLKRCFKQNEHIGGGIEMKNSNGLGEVYRETKLGYGKGCNEEGSSSGSSSDKN